VDPLQTPFQSVVGQLEIARDARSTEGILNHLARAVAERLGRRFFRSSSVICIGIVMIPRWHTALTFKYHRVLDSSKKTSQEINRQTESWRYSPTPPERDQDPQLYICGTDQLGDLEPLFFAQEAGGKLSTRQRKKRVKGIVSGIVFARMGIWELGLEMGLAHYWLRDGE